ncbi:protein MICRORCHIDIA 6 isoform X1 [Quercus robur]|uniref:protein MICRORCHIDIA 6 isoform X1 n=2 Tax=Quercus robur TaxID=38942 RepID=UPI002163AE6D|nr:protein MICRORCHIDIA 6 isoform X1 [Quercus robur]
MSTIDIVDLSSDDESEDLNVKAVKLEPGIVGGRVQQKEIKPQLVKHQTSKTQYRRQESEENRSSNALSTGQSNSSILDQGQSPIDDTSLSSSSPICPAPLCRQFWKAGSYDDGLGSKVSIQNGKSYLHVHPMFLHSNATSHKWAFGAVAELLDNAVDEIQNGATFVIVDKITNPKDGNPALLIQDDGGGMNPEAMRRCMSFGFSDKKSKSAIGQYGNGFKTSTMRLGADVIVFSRHLNNRILTQSIGLLSYTFLSRTGHDRIVVPMVDYQFNTSTGTLEILHGKEHFMSNLSMLLQWSPYSSEADLLKEFDDIGAHGTKVIIYNLWFNDDGNMELDFLSDPEDIRSSGETKKIGTLKAWKAINEQHIAHQYHYSLRVYLSILYLRLPESFNIILRGRVVEPHIIANDLKFPEFILYRPQCGGCVEGEVLTTIGFLKEAPQISFHGFNVYHKNRLILPFWQVVSYLDSRGRGVVGVLEANFIEPTHNKQDFERTSLFQKLEGRLKEMTWEYWDYHCGLIGYQVKKKPRVSETPQISSHSTPHSGKQHPVTLNKSPPAIGSMKAAIERAERSIPISQRRSEQGLCVKRKGHDDLIEVEKAKRQAVEVVPLDISGSQLKDPEAVNLLQENKKLRLKCLEYVKWEEQLNLKVTRLKTEIEEVQREHERMMAELELMNKVKDEKNV